MLKELQRRTAVLTLALLTVTVCVFAFINFQKEQAFEQPTDGVWWEEASGGLKAQRVLPDSPGERAGIKAGDLLIDINGVPPTVSPARSSKCS
jgi:two-component system NtrC family sensor kinase